MAGAKSELMASLARRGHEAERAEHACSSSCPLTDGSARLEAAHRALLGDSEPRVQGLLQSAHRTAQIAFSGAGATDAAIAARPESTSQTSS